MTTTRYLIQIKDVEPQYFVFDFPHSRTPAYVYQDMQRGTIPDLTGAKVVIDIGANVGMWSFRMAKTHPDCEFIAYEPLTINQKHLQMGIDANELKNVHIMPYGVSENGYPVELSMDPTNSGSASLYAPRNELYPVELVKTASLNDVVAPHGQVDALKIDIEGMEFHLFNGFKYWDRIKKIYMEVHPNVLIGDDDERRAQIKDLVDLLKSKIGDSNVFVDCTDTNFRSF